MSKPWKLDPTGSSTRTRPGVLWLGASTQRSRTFPLSGRTATCFAARRPGRHPGDAG